MIKKCLMAFLLATTTLTVGCSIKNTSTNVEPDITEPMLNTPMNVHPPSNLHNTQVKTVGRTYMEDNIYWLAMSGTGIEFTYTGSDLNLTMIGDATALGSDAKSQARVAVYVNNERVIDKMINKAEETITVVDYPEAQTVVIKVVKLSESPHSLVGVKLADVLAPDSVIPTPQKARRIEFIGDSITCGYGIDDEVKEHGFSTQTEDFTKTYAYKTALALDADYSIFAASGYGIISGYTDTDEKITVQTIPQYYDKIGISHNKFGGSKSPQSIEYDFDFNPQIIVINLGTNDNSYVKNDTDKALDYVDGYVQFLKQVREKNPEATILCTLGILGADLYPSIVQAVNAHSLETNDKNIFTMQFDEQNASDGIAADWHPSAKTNSIAAEKLTKEIQEIMGW